VLAPPVTRLTDATLPTSEPTWRREQRERALDVFRTTGLPDPAAEVWKYAPLDKLAIEDLELAEPPTDGAIETAVGGRNPSAVVTVRAGAVVDASIRVGVRGLSVTSEPPDVLGSLIGPDDAFCALNLALTPGPVVLDVAPGAQLDRPIVLLVDCPEGVSFPRVLVRVGQGASARILEHVTGASASLVAGVAEYLVADGGSLRVCSVQSLGPTSWSIGRTRATIGRDSVFSQAVVGLGALYDRVRADAILRGDSCESILHTAHVGVDSQIHDLRTMQVHVGQRTVSRLHSRAAVAGEAGSIYSGLITMRKGAKKADARQVNHSLVLSEHAFADAVPNLDIEENDVRCAHASAVGPVDPEQRWYLESRGVSPADAVQLIVEGFFGDVELLLDDAVLSAHLREAISRLDVASYVVPVGA
jgi:Fe-S cluster assembly protein SufD